MLAWNAQLRAGALKAAGLDVLWCHWKNSKADSPVLGAPGGCTCSPAHTGTVSHLGGEKLSGHGQKLFPF